MATTLMLSKGDEAVSLTLTGNPLVFKAHRYRITKGRRPTGGEPCEVKRVEFDAMIADGWMPPALRDPSGLVESFRADADAGKSYDPFAGVD